MELFQGRGSWGLGTGSAPEGGGHGPEYWSSSSVWTAPSDIGFDFGYCQPCSVELTSERYAQRHYKMLSAKNMQPQKMEWQLNMP